MTFFVLMRSKSVMSESWREKTDKVWKLCTGLRVAQPWAWLGSRPASNQPVIISLLFLEQHTNVLHWILWGLSYLV